MGNNGFVNNSPFKDAVVPASSGTSDWGAQMGGVSIRDGREATDGVLPVTANIVPIDGAPSVGTSLLNDLGVDIKGS